MACGVSAAVVGASLILVNVWTSAQQEEHSGTGIDGTVTASSPDPAWEEIVDQWSHDRASALSERDTEAVGTYAAEFSQVAADDRALIDSLHEQDIVYEDLSMTARLNEVRAEDTTAQLLVEWTMSSYTARHEDRTVNIEERASESTEVVRIDSKLIQDEWRIESVTLEPTGGTAAQASGNMIPGDTAG